MKLLSSEQLRKEFDRQIDNLLSKEYPKVAGIPEATFLKHISPLKDKVGELVAPEVDLEKGHLPFVIVINGSGL